MALRHSRQLDVALCVVLCADLHISFKSNAKTFATKMACIIVKIFGVLIFILCAVYYNVEANKCIWGFFCPGSQQCCNENNVCRDNCTGELCSVYAGCALGEFCCKGKCALNCSTSCRWSSDCLPGDHWNMVS